MDLVCRDGKVLVFVEVKTRRSLEFGAPADAVDLEKQRLISRGAIAWLRLLGFPEVQFRFDIVEVLMTGEATSFYIIKDAFQLPEPYRY